MNIYERYNAQRSQYRDDDDPLQQHIKNISRIFGKAAMSALDSYIIAMIETHDGRRALLDMKEIDNATKALEKGIVETVSKDLNSMIKQINKNLK